MRAYDRYNRWKMTIKKEKRNISNKKENKEKEIIKNSTEKKEEIKIVKEPIIFQEELNISAKCFLWNGLDNIDNDKIIIGGDFSNSIIKIISISEKKIIKEIKNDFWCFGIKVIKDKKIILIGGDSNNINIYNYNFECINKIQNAHDKNINGFIQIKNNLICSFSNDGYLKIWSFN